VLSFPNAKINIGLHILNRQSDGFHNIETLMLPVGLCDALEFVPAAKTSFTVSGIDLDIKPEYNLCYKVYKMLKVSYSLPPLAIHLHKSIPAGAGLGGGSADAAFMLKSLKNYFQLSISNSELKNFAAILGSDCPFFIDNLPGITTGRGEKLKPLNISLSKYNLVIVYPGINVNTAWAYKNSHPQAERPSLKSILLSEPINNWKNVIINDFEKTVFPVYPEIKRLKNKMYSLGAIYASMTGSGSAVYGIFKKNKSTHQPVIDFTQNFSCFAWQGTIQ